MRQRDTGHGSEPRGRSRLLSPVAVLLASVAILAAGCSSPGEPGPAAVTALPVPTLSESVRAQRGTLVSSEPMADISSALSNVVGTATRVVYHSASGIDGTDRQVSGAVFVPKGQAPQDGWPVVSFGHGTTGITPDCGPSRYPDLLGFDLVVASFLDEGYAVTATDFEGLGAPGAHPYFEPNSAAFDMIDAVRAARAVDPDLSARWISLGVSQGGQAAWAANELANVYGDGLQLLGSVSLAPAADMSGEAELAASGWLSTDQQTVFPLLIQGLHATRPEILPQDYLHGAYSENNDVWLSCTAPQTQQRLKLAAKLAPADYAPTDGATERLAAALRAYALPQRKAAAPMLVIVGDADEMVRPQWVRKAVTKACSIGDRVQFNVLPDQTHNNLNGGPIYSSWITDRFAGTPAPSTC